MDTAIKTGISAGIAAGLTLIIAAGVFWFARGVHDNDVHQTQLRDEVSYDEAQQKITPEFRSHMRSYLPLVEAEVKAAHTGLKQEKLAAAAASKYSETWFRGAQLTNKEGELEYSVERYETSYAMCAEEALEWPHTGTIQQCDQQTPLLMVRRASEEMK